MSFPGCLVMERSRDWLIVAGDEREQVPLDTDPSELAGCAKSMMQRTGLKHPTCILAPDSTSCFFASLSPNQDIDVRDRAALTFELEDHLPIDAESMVADFHVVRSSSPAKKVSAIAIPSIRWQRISDAMESRGLQVRSIVPRAVLAAHGLDEQIENSMTVELLLVDSEHCDSITLENKTPSQWKYFSLNRTSLTRHQLLDGAAAQKVLVVGASEAQRSDILNTYPDACLSNECVEEVVVRGARMLLNNRSASTFDLRRDALGPSDPFRAVGTQLRFAGVSLVTLLLALAVGGWWRSHTIEKQVAEVQAQQQQLFREAFPESRVPAALLRRVRSEHTKVLGSRGETSQVDIPLSAPKILRELLAALPRNVRFRIESIRVLDGRVELDLQVRSPVDAGALATSLSSAGFEVKPPGTTQKDSQTFESLLKAQWIGRAKSEPPNNSNMSSRTSTTGEAAG